MSVLIANAANVCNFLSPTINKVCYVMLCYVMSTLIHQMELTYVSGGVGGGGVELNLVFLHDQTFSYS